MNAMTGAVLARADSASEQPRVAKIGGPTAVLVIRGVAYRFLPVTRVCA